MQHAFITLVPKSNQQSVSIDDIKQLFHYYKTVTSKTGVQINYAYTNTAFPYDILDTSATTLKLQSTHDRYDSIYVGVGIEKEQSYIQICHQMQHLVIKEKQMNFAVSSEEIRRRVTII